MLAFFNPYGNEIPWRGISQYLFYIVILFCFILMISFWLFHRLIGPWYQKLLVKYNKSIKAFWSTVGGITLIFVIFRSIVLVLSDFPNLWEAIPLHFCRLMLIWIALTLIFNKFNWLKYFAAFSILGGLVALAMPDFLKNPSTKEVRVGLDSFYYWDFLLAHFYVVVMPVLLLTLYPQKLTFKESIKTFLIFFTLSVLMLIINWITNDLTPDNKWSSNYFFLEQIPLKVNIKFAGSVNNKWVFRAYHLILFAIVGIIYIALYSMIWNILDKVYINKVNNQWIFKIQKSVAWSNFKQSIVTYFSRQKKS
ncbi:YwaF family protein [Mycoplasmopsis gallinarum]|uniref:Integral membrane protein (Intg_mem_TP0381) n=1 Tax=Mycoplasmopsis gallinarum TaxID=29557 RepID=A0A168REU1_9BACT|nr:YwaF family protein [Mycoplasmopsis gallinarum]OAB48908.1 hypothetical protein MGALLINA_03480 [Mycoplasmopsis gallinarum]